MKRSISILFSLSLCLFLAFSMSSSIKAQQKQCWVLKKGGMVTYLPENKSVFTCPAVNGDTDCLQGIKCNER